METTQPNFKWQPAILLSPPTQLPSQFVLNVPGSKSFTNRALITAAITSGETLLLGCSRSDDSDTLVSALTALGISSTYEKDITDPNQSLTNLRIRGNTFTNSDSQSVHLDVGHAGTTMRFLITLCATIPGLTAIISGSERMHQRPIADLVEALSSLGASIEYLGSTGCPPLKIVGRSLPGGQVKVQGNSSSQFLSSLLLCSPRFSQGLKISTEGKLTSRSYIDMTLSTMSAFGVTPRIRGGDLGTNYEVDSEDKYSPCHYQIEGDASGASYFWGLGALTGTAVTVGNVTPDSLQGDAQFPQLIEKLLRSQNETSDLSQLSERLFNMELMPDTAQTLAVVASQIAGQTRITGLHTLKIKETDRLQAVKTELEKVGINTEIGSDYLVVDGRGASNISPVSARIATYHDHRMAMAFAMLGAVREGIVIEDPSVVTKSYPNFWSELQRFGVRTSQVD